MPGSENLIRAFGTESAKLIKFLLPGMFSSFKKVPQGLLLFLIVVLLDQVSKKGELFSYITNIGFIKIQASINSSLSFSLPGSNAVGILLSVIWLLLALWLLCRFKSRLSRLGLTFMIAGGSSNLLDRLIRGGVKDIFMLGSTYFNLADVVILIGAALVVWGCFYLVLPTQQPSG